MGRRRPACGRCRDAAISRRAPCSRCSSTRSSTACSPARTCVAWRPSSRCRANAASRSSPSEALAEGAPLDDVLALVDKHADARRGVLHARRRHPDVVGALRESRRRHRRRAAVAERFHVGARDRRDRRGRLGRVSPAAARLAVVPGRGRLRRFPARTAAPGFVVRTGNVSHRDGNDPVCRESSAWVARR